MVLANNSLSSTDFNHLKAALDEAAIVAITDRKGDITYVNDKFCAISKYSQEELLGKNHRIINSHYHSKEFFKEMWETISSGKTWEGEIRNRAKDGSQYWVNTTIVPFMDETGTPIQYVAIRYEITQRKLAEENLKVSAKNLQASNAELEQFAYVASHDLQEPLRMVASFTDLLAKRYVGKLDQAADEYMGFILDGAKRMQTLIKDILLISRISSQGTELIPTESEPVLKQALQNLKIVVEESNAIIEFDQLPSVMADKNQLQQLFQNLLGNAIKFHTDKAPRIRISADQQKGKWVFCIQDNGMGIDPQYFDKIFIIFQRLHGIAEYQGTGIGLSICKKIVERHGGKIWVESKPKEGSKFFFSLNAVKQKGGLNYDGYC